MKTLISLKSEEYLRVLVFGSRTLDSKDDKSFLFKKIDQLVEKLEISKLLILEGRARGIDLFAESYAIERGYPYAPYPAPWDGFEAMRIKKTLAGLGRNWVMLLACNIALGFWDGSSRGTKFTLDLCDKKGIPLICWIKEDYQWRQTE